MVGSSRYNFFNEVKPTIHKEKCNLCEKEILKGEKRFVINYRGYREHGEYTFCSECINNPIKVLWNKEILKEL